MRAGASPSTGCALRDAAPAGRRPVHVISKRLGHARVAITLDIYAHVLPDMQKQVRGHDRRAVAWVGRMLPPLAGVPYRVGRTPVSKP